MKAQRYIHGLDENQLEKLNFINLDRQPFIELAVEPRALAAFKHRQMLAVEFQNPALSHLILGQTCMALTLELETSFLEVLNTSQIYQITSKVRFVKELANSNLTYVSNIKTHMS